LSFSIAVAGKGGTGKTTLATLVIRHLKRNGLVPILAIDADPNTNLGESLGIEVDRTIGSIVASFNEQKISLPPGMTKESYLEFRLNETLIEGPGLDLVTMGRGQGAECYCYPNAVLRKFTETLVKNYPYMVMDNEAGLEHLSRRTTDNVDVLLLVSNHSIKGLRAVARVRELVAEVKLSIGRQLVVVTSAPETIDPVFSQEAARLDIEPAAFIPMDEMIQKYDFERRSLLEMPDDAKSVKAVSQFMATVLKK
jgi:CO dehydrogenase maturation factor